MRLFAKRELKTVTPAETQTLSNMEKELTVSDIKWFRTNTRRYLQMLRHETEQDDDSELKKEVWGLIKQHLGDIATKDLDTAPSSGGWLSMLSWGGSSAKKEDPRWEESPEEVGYVLGWMNPEEEILSTKDSLPPPAEDTVSRAGTPGLSSLQIDRPDVHSKISDAGLVPLEVQAAHRPAESTREKQNGLSSSPSSYEAVAANPLSFGIEHISPHPSNADTFLLVDVRLLRGSLNLRRGQHHPEPNKAIAAISFNGFRPIFRTFTQPNEPNAPPTWEFTSKLAKLLVTDESNPNSKFKKIVQAPRPEGGIDGSAPVVDLEEPSDSDDFDDHAIWDNPLLSLNAAQLSPKTGFNLRVEVRLEESLIFYHRRFVEEIVRFFKPPDKHETLNALFDAMMEATKEYASETMDKIRTAEAPMTRSALELAITETKANIIQLDLKAPLIILPEKQAL